MQRIEGITPDGIKLRLAELEGALEWIADQFSDAVQADCENGVRCLNERAASNYLKDAPATLAAIHCVQDKINTLLGEG
jgi:hypothetical protein